MVSMTQPRVLQVARNGVWTHDLPLAQALLYPLGYEPSLTHLCTGVVLIFGPIWFSCIIGFSWKKTRILSIDTSGENPFFRSLLVQAKFSAVDCESLTPTRGVTQQSVDCESLTPTQGATQQSVDCESLTPTQGATQQSVDCGSLNPTRGATQQSVGVEKKKEKKKGGKIAFSGIPNNGEQNQKCSPTKGNKIRSGCLSGAQKRVEMLHHPYILGDPQHRGTKSEVAASPLPSRGPKRGRKCYVTPAFLGVHYRRAGKQKWPAQGSWKKSHSGGP